MIFRQADCSMIQMRCHFPEDKDWDKWGLIPCSYTSYLENFSELLLNQSDFNEEQKTENVGYIGSQDDF